MQLARLHTLRTFAVLFAVLWTSAPLLSALHSEVHAHVYCAEHATFEEADDEGARSGRSDELPADDERTQHQECSLGVFSEQRGISSTPLESGVVLASIAPSCATVTRREYAQVPPLARAPKASPPVV